MIMLNDDALAAYLFGRMDLSRILNHHSDASPGALSKFAMMSTGRPLYGAPHLLLWDPLWPGCQSTGDPFCLFA